MSERAKQEVSAFSCHILIDPCHFLRKGVSRDTERNGEIQNFLPVTDGFVAFSHFNLHHLVGHPKKPLSCENGTNRSIKCRKMLALSVWQLNRK